MRFSEIAPVLALSLAVCISGCQEPSSQKKAEAARADIAPVAKAVPAEQPANIVTFWVDPTHRAIVHNVQWLPRTGETLVYSNKSYTVTGVEHHLTSGNNAGDTVLLHVTPRQQVARRW